MVHAIVIPTCRSIVQAGMSPTRTIRVRVLVRVRVGVCVSMCACVRVSVYVGVCASMCMYVSHIKHVCVLHVTQMLAHVIMLHHTVPLVSILASNSFKMLQHAGNTFIESRSS